MISQRTLSCLSVLSSDRDPPGKQLRSLGGGDLDLNVVARPGCGLLDPNDPVRVVACPEAAALGGAGLVDALDQHLEPAADPGGPLRGTLRARGRPPAARRGTPG